MRADGALLVRAIISDEARWSEGMERFFRAVTSPGQNAKLTGNTLKPSKRNREISKP